MSLKMSDYSLISFTYTFNINKQINRWINKNEILKGWKTVDGNFIDSDLAKTIFKSHKMIPLYPLLLLSLSHIFKYLIP